MKYLTGKEAWLAKTENKEVQYRMGFSEWYDLTDSDFLNWQTERFLSKDSTYKFRLKPRTITINGIEIPAPFKPKDGEMAYFIDCNTSKGYSFDNIGDGCEDEWIQFGAWRTEDEIKQVVNALRSILNP